MRPRRLALFGGSFDPPHLGHVAMVQAVLAGGHADWVLVAPALHPPHKPGVALASFPHRLAMLRLAMAALAGAEVVAIENVPGGQPSYTIVTLARLAAQHPGDELLLLIGGDSLRQLHTWHRAAELVARWPVLTYPRPGVAITAAELSQHWPEATARRLAETVLVGPANPVSATALRAALAAPDAQPQLADLLPPGVGEYIRTHGLYRVAAAETGWSPKFPH